MTTDPAIRYGSAAVLVSAFVGVLTIVVHGYWIDSQYSIPPILEGLLTLILGSASTLLGVHVGTIGAERATAQTAQVVKEAQNGVKNGSKL